MADILAPAPAREALIQPGAIITPPWQRWLSDVARQLGQAQVDLAVLRRDVDALRSDLDAFEALVATLQAELDALAAQVAALVQPQTTTLTVAVSGAAGLTFAATPDFQLDAGARLGVSDDAEGAAFFLGISYRR